MKIFKAIVSEKSSFYVVARTIESARAEAANTAALLFLQYGLMLKIREVVEL